MRGLILNYCLASAVLAEALPLVARRITDKEYAGNSWVNVLPVTVRTLTTGTIIFGFSSELLSLPRFDFNTVRSACEGNCFSPPILIVAFIGSAPALIALIINSPLDSSRPALAKNRCGG